MNRLLLSTVSFFVLLWSCAQSPDPAPVATADGLPALTPLQGECDFSTPLVPGIPGSPGHLIRSPRNPNGDSELSYLMRQMADDLEAARKAVAAGTRPAPLLPIHRRIRCSWPTKLDERNAQFDGMAQSYLAAVKTFDETPTQGAYNAIVQGCVSCHSVSCRGPLDRIDELVWR